MNSVIRPVRELASSIGTRIRDHREAVAAYRILQQELSSFRTPREVDDLLGSITDQEGPGAQQVREILLDNLRPTGALFRAA